jgi:hypothetical protein
MPNLTSSRGVTRLVGAPSGAGLDAALVRYDGGGVIYEQHVARGGHPVRSSHGRREGTVNPGGRSRLLDLCSGKIASSAPPLRIVGAAKPLGFMGSGAIGDRALRRILDAWSKKRQPRRVDRWAERRVAGAPVPATAPHAGHAGSHSSSATICRKRQSMSRRSTSVINSACVSTTVTTLPRMARWAAGRRRDRSGGTAAGRKEGERGGSSCRQPTVGGSRVRPPGSRLPLE